MDPISTLKIEELIHQLKDDYTIAIVTHNMQQAARVSDYTAFLYLGEMVEYGQTDDIFRNPREKAHRRITSHWTLWVITVAKHISEQYDLELSQIREHLMEMGGLVESQVSNACTALVTHDLGMAEEVRDVEASLNQLEVELDDLCVSIIAKRQPTARDLRTVVSVMKLSRT